MRFGLGGFRSASVRAVGDGSRIKKVGVGLASALVLVGLAAFIFTPVGYGFATTFQHAKISGKSAVFYGKVTDTAGKPMKNVRVALYHYNGKHKRSDAVIYTAANGTYRKALSRSGKEYVQFSYKLNGKQIKSGPRYVKSKKGHAYKINARLKTTSKFVFAPIFSY